MPEGRVTLLPAFALGVLHTVALLLVLGWFVYRGGDLGEALADVGTLPGLGIFALLWAAISGFTFFAVRPFRLATLRLSQIFGRGALWGGFTGVGFIAPFALFGLGASIVVGFTEGPLALVGGLAFLVSFGLLAAIVAFAVGAVVGSLFALLDSGLLSLSHIIAPAPGHSAGATRVEETAEA